MVSSSLSFVDKGALLGLFPDNIQLGNYLGTLAIQTLEGKAILEKIKPLRQVKVAINTRTAGHLGLESSPDKLKTFDLVLPRK